MVSKINWRKLVTVSAIVVGAVSVAGLLYASGGGGEGGHGSAGGHVSSVTPEKLKDLGWRTMNFIALMIILVKFLAKPIANGLSGRRDAIKLQFEDLEARKAQAENTYREYEKKLSAIDQDMKGIIQAAVEQGEAEKARIIEEATRAAADIRRQADMAVQQEVGAAMAKLRQDVAEKAVEMAAELIRQNLQEVDHVKLIENSLGRVAPSDYKQ